MTPHRDKPDDARISEHKENVHDLLKELDGVLLATAENAGIQRISSQLANIGNIVRRFDEGMLAAAAMAIADGPGIDSLLVNISSIPPRMEIAFPELATDSAITKVTEALQLIDGELASYLSDGETAHLVNALWAGLHNLQSVFTDCFGLWQLGPRPWTVSRLDLRIGVPDVTGRPVAYPVVKFLVDSAELLAGRGKKHQFTGWPPADILGPDTPLVPAEPARRVALYIDPSGGPAIRSRTALIKAVDDYVAWGDFRIFEGLYDAPTIQPDPEPGDGKIGGSPRAFSKGQYLAEVQRASTEREWEAEAWQTALLLDKYLSAAPHALGRWNLGWAEPAPEGTGMFSVTLWDDHYDQGLVVDLTASPGTPDQQARQMANALITTAPEHWPRTRPKPA